MLIKDIVNEMEQLAPPCFEMDWDNCGLLIGHKEQVVKKVMCALDATDDVVDCAIAEKVDMVITHHPLIFKGLKKISDEDFIGRRILKLAENNIALYAMHTSFDVAVMADEAADYLDLSNVSVLSVTYSDDYDKEGIGRVGILPKKASLKSVANTVKEAFKLDNVRVYGKLDSKLEIVAISPGSGKSVINDALKAGAQALITGDIDHHEGIDAVARGLCIIDASHYGLEKIFTSYIKDHFDNEINDVICIAYDDKAPFVVL